MANGVKWAFELVDKVTARARNIDGMLARVERTVQRVDRATHRLSGGGFGGLAKAGESSAKRVEKAWASVHTRINGMGSGLQNLQNTLFNLSFAAAPLIGAGMLGKAVIDGAGAREGSLMSLSTLLKTNDQERIRASAGWIDQFADVTPFEDRGVMQSVRQLLAAQFSFDQVKGLARITGDAASALGSDPADSQFKWEIINRALGQIKAKNRLQGDEILQLNEAGIGTDKYLKAAFGPNYRKLQEAGRIPAAAAIKAISEGLDKDFGGAMARQSKTLFGLTSTLKSRPQRLFGQLFDQGGLGDAKRFFTNLVDLTDFNKNPGKRAMTRLVASGKKLTRALFGPLADATEGERGAQLIDDLLDRLDRFSGWWETHGPRIAREAKGFGDGMKSAADGAYTLIKPLVWLAGLADRAAGGDGEGMLGKILGFGVGAAILGRIANFLSFGTLGKLGGKAGTMLLGGLKAKWVQLSNSVLTRGLLGQMLTNPAGKLAGLRAGLAALGGQGGLGALVSTGIRAIPVVGWIIAGLVALKNIGDAAYARWQSFARLMDNLAGSTLGKLFLETPETATGFNRVLHFDLARWIQGQPQAWEGANKDFLTGVNDMAGRLGVRGEDILKVMNLESGLDPKAKNWQSGAAGLIQFLPSTAKELGTTVEALRGMTREQQLPYVEKYLRMHGVKAGMGLEQLYMSVLRGNPGTGELWRSGSIQYSQNSGLDTNKDGIITSAEATGKVEAAWQRDAGRIQQTLNITISGDTTPEQVQAVRDAVRRGTLDAHTQLGLEGGWAAP